MAAALNVFGLYSAFELPRDLKIVTMPMFMMLKIAIKSHRKLLVDVTLAAISDFKMLLLSTYFGLYFSYFELPIKIKMVAIPMSRIAIKSLKMLLVAV